MRSLLLLLAAFSFGVASARSIMYQNGNPISDQSLSRNEYSDDTNINSFTQQHIQCRKCVSNNPSDDQSNNQSMVWCPTQSNAVNDWDGACMPKNQCSTSWIQSINQCPTDATNSKLTCSLCVLDSYVWYTNYPSIQSTDEYNGACVLDESTKPSNNQFNVPIKHLDHCPNFLSTPVDVEAHLLIYLSIFFAFTSIFFCCCLATQYMRRRGKLIDDVSINQSINPSVNPSLTAMMLPKEQSINQSNTHSNTPSTYLTLADVSLDHEDLPYYHLSDNQTIKQSINSSDNQTINQSHDQQSVDQLV